MNNISKYLSLVRFPHTIFAMPFALVGFVCALTADAPELGGGAIMSSPYWGDFAITLLLKIVVCMVLARNAAMGFNRWADRKFDAANPRTAAREIPSGAISPRAALAFVVINSVLFIVAAAWINKLAFALSPVALAVILGYSLCKRFTSWPHLVLGAALAIAPAGAYIAVLGRLDWAPVVLSAMVAVWTAGFDIIYSLQDADHDRRVGLHSVPARFGVRNARRISIALHVAAVALAVVFYKCGVWGVGGGEWSVECGVIYWLGTALFAASLVAQHTLPPARAARLFTLLNGGSSFVYATFAIIAIILNAN